MAFFTLAVQDKSIDEKALTSEEEYKREIIRRVLESNAWARHENTFHKGRHDAQVSTVAEEGGFSGIEKASGKKREDEQALSYDSHTKNFVVGCNCGKEKFVFDTKTDKVESENTSIRMKEIDPYKRKDDSENNNSYGNRPQGNYGNNPSGNYGGLGHQQNPSYGSGPKQNGYDRNRGF